MHVGCFGNMGGPILFFPFKWYFWGPKMRHIMLGVTWWCQEERERSPILKVV